MRTAALSLLLAAAVLARQDESTRPALTGHALIDREVQAKLTDLGLKAAPRTDDAEFLRRVTLDVVGSIPPLDQAERFLADKSADKRAKLVDALLASDAYAANWSYIWASSLVGHGEERFNDITIVGVAKQLRDVFAKNEPVTELARKVILYTGTWERPDRGEMMKGMMEGEGYAAGEGMALMYFRWQQTAGKDFPMALANKFSRLFLGIQISCAQCHDHPFDKWTQEDFYGMAAFFTTVYARPLRKDKDPQPYAYEVGDRPMRRAPVLTIADTKKTVKAGWLDTKEAPVDGKLPREEFARMLTAKSNTQFARAAVNRMWSHFFGRGIVNPPDDFNGRNKPTHPDLLEGLGTDFQAHGYDAKWLIREICASQAYQTSSRTKQRERDHEKFYAVMSVRALTPEQIMGSLITATVVDPGSVTPLQKAGILKDFRYSFGDDEDSVIVDFEGTIPAALLMMNGALTARGTGSGAGNGPGGFRERMQKRPGKGGTRLEEILETRKSDEERVRAIFVAALSRAPSARELARYGAHARGKGEDGFEDVMWTLLNSSEFLFNH